MFTVKNPDRASQWVLLLALSLGGGPAHAHARLLSSDPAPNTTISVLKSIQLHFSEEITRKFSSLRLTSGNGSAVAILPSQAPDAKSLAVTPNMALLPGRYTISWTAVATDDGHRTTGTFSFTVQ